MTRPKAYSYVRFSTPEQAKGDSQRRQQDKAKAYAARHDLQLDNELTFSDLGVSAFKGLNSKTGALSAFVSKVVAGEIKPGSYLLVESLDRLTRDQVYEAQGLFMQLIGRGINVVTLLDERVYSRKSINENPTDLIMSIVIMMRGHEESATKSRRLAAVNERKRERAANGTLDRPFTRMLPAWIEWDDSKKRHVLIPERARLLRRIFQLAHSGRGKHHIVQWLNRSKQSTWGRDKRRARFWHASYVQKILRNPAAIGVFVPHTVTRDDLGARKRKPTQAIQNYFPAAIDRAVFADVNARLSGVLPKGRNAKRQTKSIFAGVLRCATCGGTVTRVSKGTYVYLVCSGAHSGAVEHAYETIQYEALEHAFVSNIEVILRGAPSGKASSTIESEIENLEKRIANLQADTEDLAALAAETKSPAAKRRLSETEQKLFASKQALIELVQTKDQTMPSNVSRRLQNLKLATKERPIEPPVANAAIREAIREIVVSPHEGLFSIRWHHSPVITDNIPFLSKHAAKRITRMEKSNGKDRRAKAKKR